MKLTIQVIPVTRGGARFRAPSLSARLDRASVRESRPTAAHSATVSAGADPEINATEETAAARGAGVTVMIL